MDGINKEYFDRKKYFEKYNINEKLYFELVEKDEIKEVLRVFAVANADSDVDGVDMNTNKGAVNYTNETFPKNLTNGKRLNEYDIVHDYALTDYVSENVVGYGGHGDALNFAIAAYNTEEVMMGVEACDGASVMACILWMEAGISLPRNTSRPAGTTESTYESFKRELPWVNPDNIWIQKNSDKINHEHKKNQIIKNDIHFHFEDSHPQTVKMARECPNTVFILVKSPWNERFPIPDDVSDRIVVAQDDEYTEYPEVVRAYLALGKWLMKEE